MEMPKIMKVAKLELIKNSPSICIGFSIAGFITTAVMVGKATPKAMQLIEDKKQELDTDELTKLEVVKTVWPCYIPAVVTGVASTALALGANSINLRRNAALATAYGLSETALKEYKDKVVETIGEKKEAAIRDDILKDKIDNNPVNTKEIIITNDGDTLCYEPLSGRYFKSDAEKIRRGLNLLNEQMLKEDYVSLNDFYDLIGLDETGLGFDMGWHISSSGGLVEIRFVSHLAANDEPCLAIEYLNKPVCNYSEWL